MFKDPFATLRMTKKSAHNQIILSFWARRLRSMPCARICFDLVKLDVLNLICSTLLFRRQQATALRCECYPICRGDSRIARKSITNLFVHIITHFCVYIINALSIVYHRHIVSYIINTECCITLPNDPNTLAPHNDICFACKENN